MSNIVEDFTNKIQINEHPGKNPCETEITGALVIHAGVTVSNYDLKQVRQFAIKDVCERILRTVYEDQSYQLSKAITELMRSNPFEAGWQPAMEKLFLATMRGVPEWAQDALRRDLEPLRDQVDRLKAELANAVYERDIAKAESARERSWKEQAEHLLRIKSPAK